MQIHFFRWEAVKWVKKKNITFFVSLTKVLEQMAKSRTLETFL